MFQKLINIVYPNRCIICGDFTKSALNICDECTPKIEIITETTCKKCGLPQKACECSRFTYHFKALTAPFINDGAMKSGIYNLKFKGYADAALIKSFRVWILTVSAKCQCAEETADAEDITRPNFWPNTRQSY